MCVGNLQCIFELHIFYTFAHFADEESGDLGEFLGKGSAEQHRRDRFSLAHFNFIKVLGKGSFGKVRKAATILLFFSSVTGFLHEHLE